MLSPHFSLAEFTTSQTAARMGVDNTPSPEIVANLQTTAAVLEQVREILKAPILISSGYRCEMLNRLVGGVWNSAHLCGRAADFICPAYGSPLEVCQAIAKSGLKYDQLIYEMGAWTHLAWAPEPRMVNLTIDLVCGTRNGLIG